MPHRAHRKGVEQGNRCALGSYYTRGCCLSCTLALPACLNTHKSSQLNPYSPVRRRSGVPWLAFQSHRSTRQDSSVPSCDKTPREQTNALLRWEKREARTVGIAGAALAHTCSPSTRAHQSTYQDQQLTMAKTWHHLASRQTGCWREGSLEGAPAAGQPVDQDQRQQATKEKDLIKAAVNDARIRAVTRKRSLSWLVNSQHINAQLTSSVCSISVLQAGLLRLAAASVSDTSGTACS